MSEEKPTFKVTDRRLFNPDGTPRDIEREEEAPAAPVETPPTEAAATGVAAAAPSGGATQAAETDVSGAHGFGAPASEAELPPARGRDASPAAADEAGAAADEDPQDFLMVIEFIASFAADALGMVNHPGAGREVNLPLAKQCIDMLGTLQRKTRGNLNAEEQHFFELILSQLRMQYVSLSGARPGPAGGGPRGFTGGDITGGR